MEHQQILQSPQNEPVMPGSFFTLGQVDKVDPESQDQTLSSKKGPLTSPSNFKLSSLAAFKNKFDMPTKNNDAVMNQILRKALQNLS